MSKKLLNCLTVATLLATILTPVASASVINSSLSGVRTGFSSQRVKHQGSHAVEVGLVACRSNAPAANSKLDIELREHRRFMPDRSKGIRNGKGCFSRPTRVGWGIPDMRLTSLSFTLGIGNRRVREISTCTSK